MTNKKSTKRALIMSVLSLFLCFTMMLGTTYAWFTDSVTSSGNKIMAGTLDIDLFMHNDDGTVMEITDAKEPLFGTADKALNSSDTLWEPGKTQVVYLSLVNNGSLDLKYKVNVNVTSDPDNLREVMSYAITPDAENVDGKRVTAWDDAAAAPVVLGINATQAGTVELKAGETHYFALSLHMDEEAGNEYQGKTMEFDIVVFATQLASELDSFGPDYDDQATYDDGAYVLPIINETVTSDTATAFSFSNTNGTFTVEGVTENAEEDVTITVTPVANTNDMNTIAAQANSTALSYDIEVVGHKDGSVVSVSFFLGKNLSNVQLYHEGDPIACHYDEDTGMVSFETTDFSVYTATYGIVEYLHLADVTPLPTYPMGNVIRDATCVFEDGSISDVIDHPVYFADNQTLDVGFSFKALESEMANIENSPYKNWHADFVVTFNKDVASGSCAIAGYYNLELLKEFIGDDWIGFKAIDVDTTDGFDGIPANFECRLLGGAGLSVNYEEICTSIKEFQCGAFALDDSVEGTTITVELRIYETYDPADTENNTSNEETGNYETIGVYKYTFGK